MNTELDNSIFCNLPIEIVYYILSLYYGPLDSVTYERKKLVNNAITDPDNLVTLDIINNKDYSKIPELDVFNGDPWYDYMNATRLPKLEQVDM